MKNRRLGMWFEAIVISAYIGGRAGFSVGSYSPMVIEMGSLVFAICVLPVYLVLTVFRRLVSKLVWYRGKWCSIIPLVEVLLFVAVVHYSIRVPRRPSREVLGDLLGIEIPTSTTIDRWAWASGTAGDSWQLIVFHPVTFVDGRVALSGTNGWKLRPFTNSIVGLRVDEIRKRVESLIGVTRPWLPERVFVRKDGEYYGITLVMMQGGEWGVLFRSGAHGEE